jgi:hypothetical protein
VSVKVHYCPLWSTIDRFLFSSFFKNSLFVLIELLLSPIRYFMKRIFFLSAILLILHAGCRVGPKYEPPCTTVPDQWKGEHTSTENTPSVDYWWEIFNDETLTWLEWQAIENNPSIELAIQRVFEARAIAAVK